MRIPVLAAGLCLTACGPGTPATSATDGSTSSDTPAGSTDSTSATGAFLSSSGSSSDSSSDADPSTGSSGGSSGTTSDDPSSGASSDPSSDSDTDSYNPNYPCDSGDIRPCEENGEPGIQVCELYWMPDFGTYWSDCQVPIPTCDRQPLMLSELSLHDAASQFELADLDGDGALDLVAVLPEAAAVEVALGDGAGGFLAGTTYPTELQGGTQTVAVADFDGDGSPDIAVAESSDTDALSLLFGQAGVFAAPIVTSLSHTPGSLAAGDFDGDTHQDLLALGGVQDAQLVLYRGDGNGGLTPEFHDVPGGSPFAAAAGAVAGEARPDVVVPHNSWPDADVLEYAPGVGFTTIATLTGDGVTPYGHLAIGDIDGDAAPDVVAHRTPPGLQQIHTWSQLLPGPPFWVEDLRVGAIADVDGDGRGDLIARNTDLLGIDIVYFDIPCVQSHPLPLYAHNLAAGDLDGDGKADIVAGNEASVKILRTGP
jgi:hypothetical protein